MRRRFEAIGAVHLPGVIDRASCERIHRSIERCRATPSEHHGVLSEPGHALVDSDLFRWFDDDDVRALLFDSSLAETAAELLGCDDVILVEDQWLASSPGATTRTPWHQDDPYYNIDGAFVTLWLALDDAPEDAALRVVARSHTWNRTFAPAEFATSIATIGGPGGLEPVPASVLGDATLGWDVIAGDVIAVHPATLHSAGGAPTDGGWFRRLSTRWAVPTARYIDRGEQAALFWRMLPHGLSDGDLLACPTFPLVSSMRAARALTRLA